MNNKTENNSKTFISNFIGANPVFQLILGLCPALAVTTKAINGLVLALLTFVTLLISSGIIILMKKIIPEKLKFFIYLIIVAFIVTIIKLIMSAYAIEISNELGIFIPLIIVNCLILNKIETYAFGQSPKVAIIEIFSTGISYILSLTLIGIIREIISTGKITLSVKVSDWIIGGNIDLVSLMPEILTNNNVFDLKPISFFILPAGGFIILGIIVFFYNLLSNKILNKN